MDLQPKLILSNCTAYKSIAPLGHKHPRQNSSTHFRNVISIWIIIVVDLVSQLVNYNSKHVNQI